jgi:hypothetical protein
MNGFGFIEYKDAMDARDVVPGKSPIFQAIYPGLQHAKTHAHCLSSTQLSMVPTLWASD